ncbi:nuclear transport factor 2 family protein [Gilvimarinus sp. F26214L]|uniref:nuclear transport factor 2 family protein n=1 Tax=Gilvimarinus sp. DZF01 TaxID=3461371 RepID=UPI004046094E
MKKSIFALLLGTLAIASAVPALAGGLKAQDYAEIQQLYAQYNWAIDTGDGEAYADTFTPDGVFNSFEGRDALVGFIKRWTEQMNGATRKHWNSNLRITGDGKTAKGSVYLMLVDTSTQPATILSTGTYSDELVKTRDGWRFSKRSVQTGQAK